MNPEIEPLLEAAFESMEPRSSGVGRVAVEPDYESGLTASDVDSVRRELERLLAATQVQPSALAQHDGQELDFSAYASLARFIRRISLHGGKTARPWVDVVPPGNWI